MPGTHTNKPHRSRSGQHMIQFFAILLVAFVVRYTVGFVHTINPSTDSCCCCCYAIHRRDVLSCASSVAALLLLPHAANAGIDPAALRNIPVEGDTTGTVTRLRQVELNKNRPEDLVNVEYTELPSGVSFREYREGKGGAIVAKGSKVGAEMTIRCKSFSTNTEPGGVKYFATKDDTEFNEVAWTIGSGAFSPALEEGMMGMRRNALRRIEIPSTAAFAARDANQLPLPTTKFGKRIFEERLFKTDATLLFEVLVTRIK